jgi:hypothetical protein
MGRRGLLDQSRQQGRYKYRERCSVAHEAVLGLLRPIGVKDIGACGVGVPQMMKGVSRFFKA